MAFVGDRQAYGWAGSVEQFLQQPDDQLLSPLERHLSQLLGVHSASSQQRSAWLEEVHVLRTSLRDVAVARPECVRWGLVLEYELPLEGGRRPDVVVHTGEVIATLEFKQASQVNLADVDQVAAYSRDLAEYHAMSHNLESLAVLVPTKIGRHGGEVNGVRVVGPDRLASLWSTLPGQGPEDLQSWLDSDYAPLPSLVEAARMIFRQQELPRIKRYESSGVPEAVELLGQIATHAATNGHRAIAFLAGVPGAGKTLAGLQLVYERSEGLGSAVFLSGNGPLVQVLRGALGDKTFVKDLHAFIKTFGTTSKVPKENVIVFDEAQRAWDAGYMQHKKQIQASEPDLLIRIGERIDGWCSLLGLVGDGQEIHAGEEAGMDQWSSALQNEAQQAWEVWVPPRLASDFLWSEKCRIDERLDLTVSLRSRRAERLHDWVMALLDGRFADAARVALGIRAAGFPIYVTRDLEEAKGYVALRYEEDPEARYGIVASSKTQSFLPKHGVDTSWPATQRVKYSQWFNSGPGEPGSCCNFEEVVTEFGCQGLELDMPIVAWGNDLVWSGIAWSIKQPRGGYPLDDPFQLRRNAYRVLLTRGRDGLVIFIPSDVALNSTETALLASGALPLPPALAVAV